MNTASVRRYEVFDLAIESKGDNRFEVDVINSPAGQAAETARFDDSSDQFHQSLEDLHRAILTQRYDHDRGVTEQQTARAFGSRLFTSFFTDSVGGAYTAAKALTRDRGNGLRVQLRLRDESVRRLPWEIAFDPMADQFLALDRALSVTRFPEKPGYPRPMEVDGPIHVLGAAVSGDGEGPIDVEREIALIDRALNGLEPKVVVEWLRNPTWRQLDQRLRARHWHVFHYIGHAGSGLLTVDDGGGDEPSTITATELASLLNDQPALRLVVLNGCRTTPLGIEAAVGVAGALAQADISGVVTMQYQIDDLAATEMSRNLYATLARGATLDEAVSAGRRAMQIAVESTLQWAVPVVHTRALDGRLYVSSEQEAAHRQPVSTSELAATGAELWRHRRWSEALRTYGELSDLEPGNPVWACRRSLVALELGRESALEQLRHHRPRLDQMVQEQPDDLDLVALRGLVSSRLGDHEAAMTDLDRVVDAGAAGIDHYLARAACRETAGNNSLALADYSSAVALDTADPRGYFLRARLSATTGRHQDALDDLDTTIGLQPGNVDARLLRARVNRRLHRWNPAIVDLDVVIEAHPTAPLLAERGSVHHEAAYRGSTDDYRLAIDDFGTAIDLAPTVADYWYRRGRARLQQALETDSAPGLQTAVADFAAAADREPSNGQLHYYRGVALDALDRRSEARAAFAEAARLGHEQAKSKLGLWTRLSSRLGWR